MRELVIRESKEFPGYGASDKGQIYCRRRRSSVSGLTDTWRPVKGAPATGGYLGVSPWVDGKAFYRRCHVLVAECWLGPRPEGHDVHHINGNKHDDRPLNLIYLPKSIHIRLHRRTEALQALDSPRIG